MNNEQPLYCGLQDILLCYFTSTGIFRAIDGQSSAHVINVTIKLVGLESQREAVMDLMNRNGGERVQGKARTGHQSKDVSEVSFSVTNIETQITIPVAFEARFSIESHCSGITCLQRAVDLLSNINA